MMKHGTVIEMAVQRMSCTGCGAEANASCNCGKPYVPKKQQAIEAIRANPQKSNRAIADEIGVSTHTVNEARREAGESSLSPEREGRDGKVYRLPDRSESERKIDQSNARNVFLMNSAMSVKCAVYDGPIDGEIIETCRRTARAWNELTATLEEKRNG